MSVGVSVPSPPPESDAGTEVVVDNVSAVVDVAGAASDGRTGPLGFVVVVVAALGSVVDGASTGAAGCVVVVVVVVGTGVHVANNVTFSAGMVNVDPAARAVPVPFIAVFQPENVNSARVGAADATVTVAAYNTVSCVGAPVPPLAS